MPFTAIETRTVHTATSKLTQCVEVEYADEVTEFFYDDHEGGEPDAVILYHEKLSEKVVAGHLNGRTAVAKVEYDLNLKAFETERLARAFKRKGDGVTAGVTYLPDEVDPICVTVVNGTGADIKIQVERIPGTDTAFAVKGAAGEAISSTKFYSAEPGENIVRVIRDGVVIAQRTINHSKKLVDMTKAELTVIAKESGLTVTSRTTKDALIKAIAD